MPDIYAKICKAGRKVSFNEYTQKTSSKMEQHF